MTQQTYTIGKAVYTAHKSGLYFTEQCPGALRDLLADLSRSSDKVRLFYGDTATGKAWAEENDVLGTIGRSMGPCKVPLLIGRGQHGGGAVLDSCIVAVLRNGVLVYKVPGFDVGAWAVVLSDIQGYAEAVTHDGAVHARFKKAGQAGRYCQFMRGERMGR